MSLPLIVTTGVATMEEAGLLSTKEAGAILGVSPRRVLDFIKAGRLPAQLIGPYRGGRWVLRREDVEAFAAQERRKGRPALDAFTPPRCGRPRKEKERDDERRENDAGGRGDQGDMG